MDIKIGSPEWLELRTKCISATDASIINGTNTFGGNSPYKLWQRKMGLIDSEPMNEKMREGVLLEAEALKSYNTAFDTNFKPKVIFHKSKEYLMATLDGHDSDEDYSIEIKCGKKAYEQAQEKFIPPYYFDQMQHQMMCSPDTFCKYVCYRKDMELIVIMVLRDQEHIDRLLKAELEFYECLKTMTPPICGESDFIVIDDVEANEIAERYKAAVYELKGAKALFESVKKELLDATDDGNAIFSKAKLKLQRVNRTGTIDWKAVCKKWDISDIELEEFRKPSIGYPKITDLA